MLKIGDIIHGTVSGIRKYGVFIDYGENQQGLIHVSEISAGYIRNIRDLIRVGQKVTVQVIDIDEYSHKVSLSMRTLSRKAEPIKHRYKRMFTDYRVHLGFSTIKQVLDDWVRSALRDLKKI